MSHCVHFYKFSVWYAAFKLLKCPTRFALKFCITNTTFANALHILLRRTGSGLQEMNPRQSREALGIFCDCSLILRTNVSKSLCEVLLFMTKLLHEYISLYTPNSSFSVYHENRKRFNCSQDEHLKPITNKSWNFFTNFITAKNFLFLR